MKFVIFILLISLSNLLLSQAGSLDLTFGNNGKMITSFENSSAQATALKIQSDGKIVLSGSDFTGQGGEEIVAVRYMQSGLLDNSFGVNGIFSHKIFNDVVYDIEVDIDDNIFITGLTFEVGEESKTFILKLDNNGDIDSSFAQNGVWISEANKGRENFRSILIQEDGKILIAGSYFDFNNLPLPSTSTITRLYPNGAIDSIFGVDGSASVDFTGGYNPIFLTLNSEEDIILGGYEVELESPFPANIVLIKYDSYGVIDQSFGTNGVMIDETDIDERAPAIAIQMDNKIVVGRRVRSGSELSFGLVRYNEDGTLDVSFGNEGRVTTAFPQLGSTAKSILIQEDGKIILSGYTQIDSIYNYAIARYDSLGNLDTSFGNNGKVITDFGFNDFINKSILQPDGRLLCAGQSFDVASSASFSIARYFTKSGTNTEKVNHSVNEIVLFPNPTSGNFVLDFELNKTAMVSITLLNTLGQHIRNITDKKTFSEGINTISFNLGKDISSGNYFLKIETREGSIIKNIVVE